MQGRIKEPPNQEAYEEFADQIGIPRKVHSDTTDADKRDNELKERQRLKKANDFCMDLELFDTAFSQFSDDDLSPSYLRRPTRDNI